MQSYRVSTQIPGFLMQRWTFYSPQIFIWGSCGQGVCYLTKKCGLASFFGANMSTMLKYLGVKRRKGKLGPGHSLGWTKPLWLVQVAGGGGMDSPTVQVYDSGPPPPALGCFCSEPACLASGLILFSISIKISLWLARLQPGHNTAGCWWTAISKHIKTERRFSVSPYGLGSPSCRAIINAFHSYKTPAGHPNGSVGQCQCNTFKQKRTSPPKEPPTGTPPPVGFACRVRTLGRRNRLSSQQP